MFALRITLFILVALAFLLPLITAEEQKASVEYTEDKDFQDAILNVTNTYRKQHNATSLSWNKTLAKTAQDWSDDCKFKHSGGPTGENLASGYPNASASIIAWGAERDSYNFKKGDFDTKTGHFTQLVWKNTTSVGCGRTECNGKGGDDAPGWYVVCEYWPHGNVIGQFQDNVQEEVPEDEQPEGPSDPQVPDDGKDDCPQGALCGAATQLVGDRLGLVVAIVGAILMME